MAGRGPRMKTTDANGGPRMKTTDANGGPRMKTTDANGGPRMKTTDANGSPSTLSNQNFFLADSEFFCFDPCHSVACGKTDDMADDYTKIEARVRYCRRAGLTLVEVMLALVILGTGLVALVTAAGRCIGVARQAKNFEIARELLAMVEIEKPFQLEETPEDISGSGAFGAEYPGFRWVRTAEQHGFEEDGMWKISTQILWTEDRVNRREEVVTLVYWPEELTGGSFERTQ